MQTAPILLLASLATFVLGGFSGLGHAGTQASSTADPRNASVELAKSLTLDSRCKILSETERQELRDLVARAEIALASRFSVKVARETLGKGRAEAKLMQCDGAAANHVKGILKMAKQATAEAPMPVAAAEPALQPTPPATTIKPKAQTAEPAPSKIVAVGQPAVIPPVAAAPAQPAAAKKPPAAKLVTPIARKKAKPAQPLVTATRAPQPSLPRKKSNLSSYASLAEDYYVELKCRSLSAGSAQRMYNTVLVQHRAAVATGGAAAVRKLLRQAQNRAGQRSCG